MNRVTIFLIAGLVFASTAAADTNSDGAQLGRSFEQPTIQAGIAHIDIEPSPKDKAYPIRYSERQWREQLSDFEYHVLREEGTEYAFSGRYNNEKRPGIYYSRATGQPLFSSEHKYDSGTGWPSFWRPIRLDAVEYHVDRKFFIKRTEVVDSSSGSHLGHIFPDGPRPTGLRFCLNSASLIFVPEGEAPPEIVRSYLARYGDRPPR